MRAAEDAGLEVDEQAVFEAEAGKAACKRWVEIVEEHGEGARDEAHKWFEVAPEQVGGRESRSDEQ